MVIQDDYYEGHFIPKGTILFANAWAIHMDEDEYDSPHEYRPERFIADKYGCKSAKNTSDQRRVTWFRRWKTSMPWSEISRELTGKYRLGKACFFSCLLATCFRC